MLLIKSSGFLSKSKLTASGLRTETHPYGLRPQTTKQPHCRHSMCVWGGGDDDDAPLLNASFLVPFWLLLDIWKHPVCICVAEQLTAMQSHSKGRMEGGGGSFSPIKAQQSGVDPPTSIHALSGLFGGEGVGCCSPILPLQPQFAPAAPLCPTGCSKALREGLGFVPPPPQQCC